MLPIDANTVSNVIVSEEKSNFRLLLILSSSFEQLKKIDILKRLIIRYLILLVFFNPV